MALGVDVTLIEPDQRIYLAAFARTFLISGSVTLICLTHGHNGFLTALLRDEYPPFRLDQGPLESRLNPEGTR